MKLHHSIALALLSLPSISIAALGPIIITPSAYEQTIEESSLPITVIDQKTIQDSGANTVAQLLRGQAGLHISDLFGDGSQTSVDLRGFGPTASSNTLILLDGRRLNNSSDSAAPDLSTIDVDNIQQIEIIQGSAGVLYGNQAVGGVINIISKKAYADQSSIKLGAGSYNNKRLTLSSQKQIGKTQLSVLASSSSSDNYRDHNKADRKHVDIRAQRQHDSFSSYIEYSYTDEHLLTPGALLQTELDADRNQSLAVYNNDYFDTKTSLLRLGINKNISQSTSLNLDLSKRVNDREFIQSFRTFAGTLSTQDRDSLNFSGKLFFTKSNSKTIVGLSHEDNDYKLVSSFGPQPLKQKITSVYFSSDIFIDSASTLNIGVRGSKQYAQHNSDNFNDSQTIASLGYTWKHKQFKTYIRADQNLRFPTVEEHTNTGFGNPVGLATQTGISLELGTEYQTKNDRIRASLYQLDLNHELAYDGSIFANVNLDKTRRKGFIIEAQHSWDEDLASQLSLTFLDAKITDGSYDGKTLPLVPEKTLRLNTSYQINNNILWYVDYIYVSDQIFGGDFNNTLGKLESYTTVNTNINYKLQNWSFSFRINNLLDEHYSEQGNQFTDYSTFPASNYQSFFPAPERNYWLSAQYKF